MMGDANGGGLA